jgi:hypothetical protein
MLPLVLSTLLLAPLERPPAPKIHAEADWPFAASTGDAPKRVVIRSLSQLVHAHAHQEDEAVDENKEAQRVATALRVKEIDWKRQMLIVVHEGEIRNPRRLEVILSSGEKLLIVQVTSIIPGAEREPFKEPRYLSRVYLVDRFDDEVKFTHQIRALK